MSAHADTRPELPALAFESWAATKETLHRWVQIVGKVRLGSTSPRNHWWNVALYVDVRGLTTRRMRARSGVAFQIDLDFVDHRLVIRSSSGAVRSFPLVDALSVAEFHRLLHAALAELGLDVSIREVPFGIPDATPFSEDRRHASYDRDAVERFWRILDWTDSVLEEFAGWYCGKTSPVHLFWHSLDLALTRFDGRRAPVSEELDRVNREAYSHEVASFGFWAGDDNVREPTYYAYAAPEPPDVRSQPLRPAQARWIEQGTGSLAVLPYHHVRAATNPRKALLAFLESGYRAGARGPGWDRDDLTSSWCPDPPELAALLS